MTFTEQLVLRYDDICTNKHGFNEQSIEANKRVLKETDRNAIIKYLQEFKTGTSKQIAEYLGKQLNKISGRFTEMRIDKTIEILRYPNGDTPLISGCVIYRLTKKNEN